MPVVVLVYEISELFCVVSLDGASHVCRMPDTVPKLPEEA